jgi:hypothetical protein
LPPQAPCTNGIRVCRGPGRALKKGASLDRNLNPLRGLSSESKPPARAVGAGGAKVAAAKRDCEALRAKNCTAETV